MDYAAAVFAAVSALVRFTLFAGVWDGVEALVNSDCSECEEGRAECGEVTFERWLIEFAVAAAYELRQLSSAQLNPGRQTEPRLDV
jgi:hypothetical protein